MNSSTPSTSRLAHAASAERPWWPGFFDDFYAEIGLRPHTLAAENAVASTAAFLERVLELQPGCTVLDQCCGIGRLSLPLAARGHRVVGVDLADGYVARASKAAAEAGLPCELVAGDAAHYVAPRPCDAAFNWFTSFGYHASDEANRAMLDRAVASLKPGAPFALDYFNAAFVVANFREHQVDTVRVGGVDIVWHQTSRLDLPAGMVEYEWTFEHPDGRRDARAFRNRLLMPHELVRLLEAAGFVDVRLLGSIDGEPLARDSRRCIALARRPRS